MNIDSSKEQNPIKFSGAAGPYFGILFVNGLLNMITLGIYSPWAKVRALQYLYGNTSLVNSQFHFTADPKKMLVSRLIAMALLITFIFVENFNSKEALVAYGIMIAAFVFLSPVLTVSVMSFRLRSTRWRGINFNFVKDYKGAYRVYLAPTLLLGLVIASLALPFYSLEAEQSLGMERHLEYVSDYDESYPEESSQVSDEAMEAATYQEETEEDSYLNPYFFMPSGIFFLLFLILVPYFDFINARFLMRNVRYGTARFSYDARAVEFYKMYVIVYFIALLIFALFVGVVVDEVSLTLFGFSAVISWVIVQANLKSKRYNLLYGRTSIDNQRFYMRANVPTLKMLYIMVTNTLAVIVSFGMLRAWAQIRTIKLMLDHTSVETEYCFDTFIAEQNEQLSAFGEEIADVFDHDFAF